MDLRDFQKAVAKTALALAPAYQAGGVAVLSAYAPPLAPFAAATPPATFLGIGQPLLYLLPEYRAEVARELDPKGGAVDYAKLGEMAALAALSRR